MTSLLEGLEEMLTINRLGLPSNLCRCLGITNIIESPNTGIRQGTGRADGATMDSGVIAVDGEMHAANHRLSAVVDSGSQTPGDG